MVIVPGDETAFRRKTRRRLALDLFTRYGTFWSAVDSLRNEWHITPKSAVPPEPAYAYGEIPFRFHLPDEPPSSPWLRPPSGISECTYWAVREREPWMRASRLFTHLEDLWSLWIPDDIRDGSNAGGWYSWITYLSACLLYDPPSTRLLEYADHDDHDAAAHPFPTHWKQSEPVIEGERAMQRLFETGDPRHWDDAVGAHARSWQPTRKPPRPTGRRGRPSDDLQDVQCAIWRNQGLSTAEIAKRFGWSTRSDAYEKRQRSDAAEDAVQRGRTILEGRGAMARIIQE